MWRSFGLFDANRSDCNLEKVIIPENTLFYVNQAYLTVLKNKKTYYCDYYILGQVVEASNSPDSIGTYVQKDREARLVRSRYSSETGSFLGLYENVGFIIVRGDSDKVSFNYGFDKQTSKVFCSHYKRRISSSFSEIIYDRHWSMLESGELESDTSHLYFFIPSVTDHSEEINHYMKNVCVTPIDIKQEQFNAWSENTELNPSHLDVSGI